MNNIDADAIQIGEEFFNKMILFKSSANEEDIMISAGVLEKIGLNFMIVALKENLSAEHAFAVACFKFVIDAWKFDITKSEDMIKANYRVLFLLSVLQNTTNIFTDSKVTPEKVVELIKKG